MSVHADAQGNLSGQIRVPFGLVRSGSREFVLTGDLGSVARMTVHFAEAEGGPTHQRPFDQSVRPLGAQAIAQTFRLSESRFIRQVQVRFCAIGDARNPVWMQIRETENGIPTQVILGEKVLYPPRVTVAVQGGWTSFQFDPPIPAYADVEYAIVLMATDPDYTVEIGQLGHYVNEGDGPTPPYPGWITNQPYQVGVLQVSSDIDSWTAIQDTDLVFRIMGCKFSSPYYRNVTFGDVPGITATDAMVKAIVHRPFGAADAHFTVLHVASGETHTDLEGAAIRLQDRRIGTFRLSARLDGDEKSSPVVFPNARLELGNQIDTGDYITVPIDAGDQFNCTVIYDAYRAPGTTITVSIAVQRFTGTPPVAVLGSYDWIPMTVMASSVPIGNGWTEETWRITDVLRGIQPDYMTRIKVHLAGTPANRPIIRNLRAITILAA